MSSNPQLMKQLFGGRKRKRPSSVPPEPSLEANPPGSARHKHTASKKTQKDRCRRRMVQHLHLHRRAVQSQDPDYAVVQRCRNHDKQSTQSQTRSSSPLRTPWERALPQMLLMTALAVQCHTIQSLYPSYEELLLQRNRIQQDRDQIAQRLAKISDQYRRFTQHVKTQRYEYEKLICSMASQQGMASCGAEPEATSKDLETKKLTPDSDSKRSMRSVTSVDRTHPERRDSKVKANRVSMSPTTMRPPKEVSPYPVRSNPSRLYTSDTALTTEDDSQTIISSPRPTQPRSFKPVSDAVHRQETKETNMEAGNIKGTIRDAPLPIAATTLSTENTNIVADPKTPEDNHTRPNQVLKPTSTDSKRNMENMPRTSVTLGTGWMSSRPSKAFVEEVKNTVSSKPVHQRQAPPHPRETSDRTKVPLPPPTLEPGEQPFCEVVRGREARQLLKPHECAECGAFLDALSKVDPEGLYDHETLLNCSRHRARFTPPETPDDFWELSFIDERDARYQTERGKTAG